MNDLSKLEDGIYQHTGEDGKQHGFYHEAGKFYYVGGLSGGIVGEEELSSEHMETLLTGTIEEMYPTQPEPPAPSRERHRF